METTKKVTAESLFINHHKDLVLFLTYKLNGNKELAKELASETFVKVCTNIDTYNPTKGTEKNWLFTIGVNTVIDYFRVMGNTNVKLSDLAMESNTGELMQYEIEDHQKTDSQTITNETLSLIEKTTKRLSKFQKEVYRLYFEGGYSVSETAEMLDISISNVKTTVHRIRTIIQPKLMPLVN